MSSGTQAYLAQIGGVPVLVLKEGGTQRAFGKEAMRINIMVAKAVAEVMKSTLGPPRVWIRCSLTALVT